MNIRALILILLLGCGAHAQVDSTGDGALEFQIESLADQNEENQTDFTQIAENYELYRNYRLSLNTATVQQMEDLNLLTVFQINALINYRKSAGKLLTMYELSNVEGFDQLTIQQLLPFVTVSAVDAYNVSLGQMLKYGRSDLLMRYQRTLEESKGYSPADSATLAANPNARYLGNPDKYFVRYSFRYRDRLQLGFTAEKDAGEEFFTGTQKQGFDYYSFRAYYQGNGLLKNVALGDYAVEFGQGLHLWSGYAFGKSANVMNVQRFGRGIRPYAGVNENRFMRGAAATFDLGAVEATLFYSNLRLDANINAETDSLGTEEQLVSSLQETGLHRTPRELAYKDAVGTEIMGGHVKWKSTLFNIGLTASRTRFDKNIQKGPQLYQLYNFEGTGNSNVSVDYHFILPGINFFGETALSESGGWATLNGLQLKPQGPVDLITVYRRIGKDYHALWTAAFAESQTPGEEGLYTALQIQPTRQLMLRAYYDLYRFDWFRYLVDGPSEGQDIGVQAEYQPKRYFTLYLRLRHESNMRNSREELPIDIPVPQVRRSIRLHVAYAPNSEWKLQSRIEMSRYTLDEKASNGLLLYQDVSYRALNSRWSLYSRLALFRTDSYDSRIYAYEQDVLYSFSIPAYSGTGMRVYLMLNYEIMPRMDLWLRWAQSYYTDRSTVGSGLDEIPGNTRTEIKAQLRWRF